MTTKQKATQWAIILWLMVNIAVIVVIRLTHSELTETQLFLDFLPVWVSVIVQLFLMVRMYQRVPDGK